MTDPLAQERPSLPTDPSGPPPAPVSLAPTAEPLAQPLAEAPVIAAANSDTDPVELVSPTPVTDRAPQPYWNSYAAGVVLGLVLLTAFVVTGRGLGASGAVTRMGALTIQKVEASVRGGTAHERETIARSNSYTAQYINDDADALDDFLVYLFIGVIVGGFIAGLTSGRTRLVVERGPNTTMQRRLALAMLGGFISAFGARLARGCTSGQALTGGATLAVGSWAFMLAVFAGGYGIAYFVRKEWL